MMMYRYKLNLLISRRMFVFLFIVFCIIRVDNRYVSKKMNINRAMIEISKITFSIMI